MQIRSPQSLSELVLLSLLFLLPAIAARGQDASGPQASIDDVAWIAGHWQGAAMGGQFEETWNPPSAGTMLGMFKFSQNGKVGFYEILTIVPQGESLILRLKHFDAGLKGWEEKDESVEFPLQEVTDQEIRFKGLVFRKVSDDELHITVSGEQGGTVEEIRFVGRRAGSRD
jgi:hypothetical protein